MRDLSLRVRRRAVLQGGLAAGILGSIGPFTATASPRPRPAVVPPTIAGTDDWGARDETVPIEIHDTTPTFIVVHHTATENSPDTSQEHAFELARYIQDLHMDNGWGDTGQNFTNSRGGWLMEGRHESLPTLQGGISYVEGIHAGDANEGSQGIENEGTYTSVDVPDELWNSLVGLCAYICSQYAIPAEEIYGHRDFMTTECPGEILYGRLPELREAVGGALGTTVVQPVTWPLLKPGQTGPRVAAAQHLMRAKNMPLAVNGAFDQATARAVRSLAERSNIPAPTCHAARLDEPGMLGADLWPLLTPPLRTGHRGAEVRAVQLLLTANGQQPEHSGTFSARTDAAVRAFQDSLGLKPTGTVDRTTWQQLLS